MRFRDETSEEWVGVSWISHRCAACSPGEETPRRQDTVRGAIAEGEMDPEQALVQCELCHFSYCEDCAEPLGHDCVEVAWHFNGVRL